MKIAIDVTASIYKGMGIATYYTHLVPWLLSLDSGHEILPFGYSLRRMSELNLAVKKFPIPPSLADIVWNRLHVFPIERLIGACDVLHSWDYIQPPTQKAKLVTTIHDLTPLKFPSHHHPRTRAAYKAGVRWVKKEAAAVIADSVSTKADIVELLEIPEEKVHVVYLAASREFSDFRARQQNTRGASIQQVRQKYGIQGEYLLAVGTQEPRKNLERAIKAFDLLKMDASLVVVGRFGWGARVRPVEGVKILGYVPQADLPPLYAGASCFLYPSLYEGFGLPVLEAMAVGCPVVTSNRGSLKEVAADAAVEVDPESVEAIAFGVNVALKRREELSKRGIARSQKFSWQETASRTIGVYESVMNAKSTKE